MVRFQIIIALITLNLIAQLLSAAAVFFEHFLDRSLLYLPCRHHVFELILRLVFETKILATTNPNISLFERFKKGWGTKSKVLAPKFTKNQTLIILLTLQITIPALRTKKLTKTCVD